MSTNKKNGCDCNNDLKFSVTFLKTEVSDGVSC